jgi:hypothetical protein
MARADLKMLGNLGEQLQTLAHLGGRFAVGAAIGDSLLGPITSGKYGERWRLVASLICGIRKLG